MIVVVLIGATYMLNLFRINIQDKKHLLLLQKMAAWQGVDVTSPSHVEEPSSGAGAGASASVATATPPSITVPQVRVLAPASTSGSAPLASTLYVDPDATKPLT